MFVKVCGIKKTEQIDWAVSLGYSAIGVVLHRESIRYCDADTARKLSSYGKGKIKSVAVGVTYSEVKELQDHFDYIQVYEEVSTPHLIFSGSQAPNNSTFEYFLYDSSKGSGRFHELPAWLHEMKNKLIISGGLNPDNVKNVIEQFNPFGVDVSSGVENPRGTKNFNLMKKFIEEVRNATA